jgi:hypothetical protein
MARFTQTQVSHAADMLEYIAAHNTAVDRGVLDGEKRKLSVHQHGLLEARLMRTGFEFRESQSAIWDQAAEVVKARRFERARSIKRKQELARERAEALRDEREFA